MPPASDTIAAIATAPGRGGIAVLRISGPEAAAVLRRLFLPATSPGPDAGNFSFEPRRMHYGQALDALGKPLDEVLAVYMPGPRSFTGEDVGEIHCHGGHGVSSALLEAAVAAGARCAAPGEFTRRAFLNGRLDLTQAEAVAEIINASGRQGVRLAKAKLEGALGAKIAALRAGLDALRIQVTLAVDFAEEEAELLPRDEFARVLAGAESDIQGLLAAFERARLWREGALAVLAGRVNAGKSSLLNALLGRERAIVSASPGTTRDYIEEQLNLAGLPLRIVDTAGLRQSGDLIENEGMQRSRDLAEQADLLLLVCEMRGAPLRERPETSAPATPAGSTAPAPGLPAQALAPPAPAPGFPGQALASPAPAPGFPGQALASPAPSIRDEEDEFLRRHRRMAAEGRLLLVMNKADLLEDAGDLPALAAAQARERLARAAGPDAGPEELEALTAACPVFAVSAKTGLGLDELARGMRRSLTKAHVGGEGGDVAPNVRQSGLLRQSLEELRGLSAALAAGHPPDILAVHMDTAAALLDEVTGKSGTEELLDAIFSSFCIGK